MMYDYGVATELIDGYESPTEGVDKETYAEAFGIAIEEIHGSEKLGEAAKSVLQSNTEEARTMVKTLKGRRWK